MSQGRKDMLPGEVPDSVMNVPTIKGHRSPMQHRTTGFKASSHKTGGTAPIEAVELPDDALAEFLSGPMAFNPEAEYTVRSLVPKGIIHDSDVFKDEAGRSDLGEWVWICQRCDAMGEGTRDEVRAAARHHKLTS